MQTRWYQDVSLSSFSAQWTVISIVRVIWYFLGGSPVWLYRRSYNTIVHVTSLDRNSVLSLQNLSVIVVKMWCFFYYREMFVTPLFRIEKFRFTKISNWTQPSILREYFSIWLSRCSLYKSLFPTIKKQQKCFSVPGIHPCRAITNWQVYKVNRIFQTPNCCFN